MPGPREGLEKTPLPLPELLPRMKILRKVPLTHNLPERERGFLSACWGFRVVYVSRGQREARMQKLEDIAKANVLSPSTQAPAITFWHATDKPMQHHKQPSPSCPWEMIVLFCCLVRLSIIIHTFSFICQYGRLPVTSVLVRNFSDF